MESKAKLKGEEIFIDNDLTWNERRVREKIVKLTKQLRGAGKKVRIGYSKVIGENEEWIWDKREQKFFHKEEEDE